MGHQFTAGRHVDAIDVGVAHRGGGTGHVHLARPGLARHLHDLAAGGAAHDGVVHQQHVAALEFAADDVELLAHRLLAHRLPRHDESAAHIAVFDKTLTVGNAQQLRQLHGAGAARFRNGDDHVDFVRRHGGDHALGQRLAQVQTRLVHRDAIEHRVRTCQVHKLKNARMQAGLLRTLARVDLAVERDEQCLARLHVALELVPRALQRHRLAGHHPGAIAAAPHGQGTDAVGVTKGHHAMACDQGDHGIRAPDALVHRLHGRKHIVGLQGHATAGHFQFVGKHVEQHFRVALGVGVAVVDAEQLGAQGLGVGQVAVVHHDDAKGRVHIERLRFLFAESVARRGIAYLPQARVARQSAHVAGAEHVTHHALGLVHEELAVQLRGNASRILAAVLQEQQSVIDQLVDGGRADHADDSTHSCLPSQKIRITRANACPAPAATAA